MLFFPALMLATDVVAPAKDPLEIYSDCVRHRAVKDPDQTNPELVADRAITACQSLRKAAAKTFMKNRQKMGHWEFDMETSAQAVDAVARSRISTQK